MVLLVLPVSFALTLLFMLISLIPRPAKAAICAEVARPKTGVQWGLLPIGNYTTDRGLSLGAVAQRFNYGEEISPFLSLWTLRFSHSTRGPVFAQALYDQTGLTAWNLRLHAELTYYDNPYENYFGEGADSGENAALSKAVYYLYRQRTAWASASVRRHHSFGLDFEAGAALVRTASSENQQASQFAADYDTSPQEGRYIRTYLRVIYEGRDSEFVPSDGHYAAATIYLAPGALSTMPSWSRLDAEYRRYDPIIKNRWLWLASQAKFSGSSADSPLIEKARLGSLGTMRGLPLNRFVGRRSATLRTELRSLWCRGSLFSLPFKLGSGIFVDAGKIAESTAELFERKPELSYGMSFFGSYFTDDFVGSASIGASRHGTALYLKLGHAF